MKSTYSAGLTFIEILVAILILGILALTSSFAYTRHYLKARDAERKTYLHKIKNTLYDYYTDYGCFPSLLPSCGEPLMSPGGRIYSQIPCEPTKSSQSYAYETDGLPCPQKFKILTNLENPKDESVLQAGCAFGCGDTCNYNYGLTSTNESLNANCIHYFACSTNGQCVEFADPQDSGCPLVFENQPDCNNLCSKDKNIRCHDARGLNDGQNNDHKSSPTPTSAFFPPPTIPTSRNPNK